MVECRHGLEGKSFVPFDKEAVLLLDAQGEPARLLN